MFREGAPVEYSHENHNTLKHNQVEQLAWALACTDDRTLNLITH